MSKIQSSVENLKTFIKALKKRPDVKVEIAQVGRKAKAKDVERIRSIHSELAELYAEMNGVHVEWRFIEPSGGGCIRIPTLSSYTQFENDEVHYMNFGEGYEALLLDEITPEGGTWLVKDDNDVTIEFAATGRGDESILVANSIAEYIDKAIENGFTHYWPRCIEEENTDGLSYEDFQDALDRFKAPPKIPSKFLPGKRVQFTCNDHGRGEILEEKPVPQISANEFYKDSLIKVRTDLLYDAWLPTFFAKVHSKSDAYERFRNGLPSITPDSLQDLLSDITMAIGELEYFSQDLPSHSKNAAGILIGKKANEKEFANKLNWVLSIMQTIKTHKLSWDSKISFKHRKKTKETVVYKIILGLLGGLYVYLTNLSALLSVSPSSLVTQNQIKILTDIKENETKWEYYEFEEQLQRLIDLSNTKSPVKRMDWAYHGDAYYEKTLKNLDLPSGEVLYYSG